MNDHHNLRLIIDNSDEEEDPNDPFVQAEQAEQVRGRHHSDWWDEVERLSAQRAWTEVEALLVEMRDAVERGARIVGWPLAPAPALRLAGLYRDAGRIGDAVAELERYLSRSYAYRVDQPAGGDNGVRRATEMLDRLR